MHYLEQWCNPVAGLDSYTVILYKLIHCKTRKHWKGAAIPRSTEKQWHLSVSDLKEMHRRSMDFLIREAQDWIIGTNQFFMCYSSSQNCTTLTSIFLSVISLWCWAHWHQVQHHIALEQKTCPRREPPGSTLPPQQASSEEGTQPLKDISIATTSNKSIF